MRHRIALTPDHLGVSYQFDYKRVPQTIAVTAQPTPAPILPGSLEEFITEHYFGYTLRRRRISPGGRGRPAAPDNSPAAGARTSEYAVQHPRWLHYPVLRHYIRVDFASIYGRAFADLTPAAPDHILLAEGSAVTVLRGARL
jgi:hypothetical protein